MKLIKILLLVIVPIISFAEIEYIKINHLDSVKEGNLTRITKINNQTFEYFRIYMNNNVFKNLNKDCLVKFDTKEDDFTLSTGKPFICKDTYLELNNKNLTLSESNPHEFLLNNFYYEVILPRLGMVTTLLLFILTFIIYLITNKDGVLIIGIVLALTTGFIIGLYTFFNPESIYNKYPYNKIYLVKYYDNIEEKIGHKVFRAGFYPGNILEDNNLSKVKE